MNEEQKEQKRKKIFYNLIITLILIASISILISLNKEKIQNLFSSEVKYYTTEDTITKEDIVKIKSDDKFLYYSFKNKTPSGYYFYFRIFREEEGYMLTKGDFIGWKIKNLKTDSTQEFVEKKKEDIEQFSNCLESSVKSINIFNEKDGKEEIEVSFVKNTLNYIEYKVNKNKLNECVLTVYNTFLKNIGKNPLSEEQIENYNSWNKR